jgi:ADP-ribosylation factor-like protein 8
MYRSSNPCSNARSGFIHFVFSRMWDLGGQSQYRQLWERYCFGMQAIVYIVDSADADLFEEARKELHSLLSKTRLANIPLLLLANKSDLENAEKVETIVKMMELDKLKDREVAYYSISCKNSVNIDITLQWLIAHSKK